MAALFRKTGDDLAPDKDAFIDPRDTAKYLLRVTAGPSYDDSTHGQVQVNGDEYVVDNEYMTASIDVRIKDYHGLPRSSPPTHPYFSHPNHKYDRYSISFSFTPKKDIPGEEIIMGFDFDRPIRDRLPPLFKPALKFVTTIIDPGIYCDAYADKPYLYGAALSSFYILRIGNKSDPPSSSPSSRSASPIARKSRIIVEGADGSGVDVRKRKGMPDNSERRRKFFLKKQHIQDFTFEAGREYEADFFNPYLDFANFAVRLPGFSTSVARYIDEKTHTLRYVLKNRRTDEVYFVVVFTLLFGQELKDALKDEPPTSPVLRVQSGEQGEESTAERTGAESDDNAHLQQHSNDQEGLIASLGKWLPKMLRSGGTPSGVSTPAPESRASSLESPPDRVDTGQMENVLRDQNSSV